MAFQDGVVLKRAGRVLGRGRLNTRRGRLNTRAWQHARGRLRTPPSGGVLDASVSKRRPGVLDGGGEYARHARRISRFKTARERFKTTPPVSKRRFLSLPETLFTGTRWHSVYGTLCAVYYMYMYAY